MAFKGLEERFLSQMDELYSKNGGSEIKPSDSGASSAGTDSRLLPVVATKRDITRLGNLLKSRSGLVFLGKEALQQSANAFSETRVLNPLFVIGNAVPFVHLRRPLTGTSDFAAKGNIAHASPAAMDPYVGGAGRLQQETSDSALAKVTGQGGNNSLLGRFSLTNLLQTARGIFRLGQAGSLAIDDRPELHVNGTYYSIAVWHGFSRKYGSRGALESAAASLRVGDVRGALTNLKNAGSALLRESGLDRVLGAARLDGRNLPTERLEGWRYFITDERSADRYLQNSVDAAGDRPYINLSYLNRRPYFIPAATAAVDSSVEQTVSQFADSLTKSTRLAGSFLSGLSSINNIGSFGNTLLKAATGDAPILESDNPAHDHMLFSGLSLQERYKSDAQLADMRNHLQDQITSGLTRNPGKPYFLTRNSYARTGVENKIDPRIRHATGGYLSDPLNVNFEGAPKDGDDIISVYITDDVNGRIVPFRAFVSNIREIVTPEAHDARYIGRVERNIVYLGVSRELSFTMRVHAFSHAELQGVWEKVNFLTGLCYPAKFNNGFMVPPFVKMTLGDLYKNQPGFFRNVSYDVEDGTSWEITPGEQVPYGVMIQIAFSILDKRQYTSENTVKDGFVSITKPQS